MESRGVRNWVESEARFLKVDLSTDKGKEFYEREARKAAIRVIQ